MFKLLRQYWLALKEAAPCFIADNAFKMSASLSYYTIFSLAPMLLIITAIGGIFFGTEAVQGQIYNQIAGLVGPTSADLVQEMVKNAHLSGKSTLAIIIGVITLILGATGVFTEIQDSVNTIWSLKAKPKRGWLKFLTNRLLSFSMVVTLGFLLLVSLTINAVLEVLSDRLFYRFAELTWVMNSVNVVLILIFVSILFACIFRVLPDAHITWRDTMAGAIFTALLFMLGKFAIGYYLSSSSIGTTYGAAGSMALMLAWIYYSSLILFFGAEFTKVYAARFGTRITPNAYAVFVIKQEQAVKGDAETAMELQKKANGKKESEKKVVDAKDKKEVAAEKASKKDDDKAVGDGEKAKKE